MLFQIAEELGLREIVNSQVKKRKQGMTPGDYILLSALNRALSAKSKSKISEWVDSTTLHMMMKIDQNKLSSQNFWDHFDHFTTEQLEVIADTLARKAVELEKIDLDCLVYDTTNYYNYWDVLNASELSKMTKSKAGKHNLRHIGLALGVDRDWGLPLFHRLYPANNHDSKVFQKLFRAIAEQVSQTLSDKKSITLIFDKGNNSEEIFTQLDESRHHFIGTRSPYHHPDLCQIPIEKYDVVEMTDAEGEKYQLPAHETRQELYGKSRRLLVVYNESTYQRQLHRLEKNLEKAKEELSFFKKRAKTADGRSTLESIHKRANEIIDRYHLGGLVEIQVQEEENGFSVSGRKNIIAVEEAKTRFGKQILFSDRETLTRAEMIQAYLDRAVVENTFRITKSDLWVKWGPAFHWTDSKIRVHALTCMIALLLVKIAHKRAVQKGFQQGAERMLELLQGVMSSLIYYPQSNKPERMLCCLSSEQEDLLTKLNYPLKNSM